jgi:biotin synthase
MANSIFTGDKLLTTPNPDFDADGELFQSLGLKGRPAFSAPLQYQPRELGKQTASACAQAA